MLQTVPSHIKLEDIQRKIEEVSGLFTFEQMICVHVTIVKKKKKKNLNPLVKPKLHKLVSDKE